MITILYLNIYPMILQDIWNNWIDFGFFFLWSQFKTYAKSNFHPNTTQKHRAKFMAKFYPYSIIYLIGYSLFLIVRWGRMSKHTQSLQISKTKGSRFLYILISWENIHVLTMARVFIEHTDTAYFVLTSPYWHKHWFILPMSTGEDE